MNKPVYQGLSILEIRKTLMHGLWHDCIKPKYQSNVYGYDIWIQIALSRMLKLKMFISPSFSYNIKYTTMKYKKS